MSRPKLDSDPMVSHLLEVLELGTAVGKEALYVAQRLDAVVALAVFEHMVAIKRAVQQLGAAQVKRAVELLE